MNKSHRLEFLDGLRGIAAAIVVVHHLMIGFFPTSYTLDVNTSHLANNGERVLHNTPLGLGINGGFAVGIFLILSGYVVGLNEKEVSWVRLLEQALKRFARFFFPILATHAVVWAVLKTELDLNQAAAALTESWWWLGTQWQNINTSVGEMFGQAFLSLFKSYPLDQVYNSSTWTMPFFFLGPLSLLGVNFLIRNRLRRRLVIGLLLLVTLKTHYWPIYLGYFLAKVLPLVNWAKIKKISWVGLPILLVLANYPQAYDTANDSVVYSLLPVLSFTHTSTFYHVVAAILLLIMVYSSDLLKRILSSRLAQFLGRISFSLYLFHILVINTLTSGLFVWFRQGLNYELAFFVAAGLSLPVIIIGSWCLYRYVELPTIRISRSMLEWKYATNKITAKK